MFSITTLRMNDFYFEEEPTGIFEHPAEAIFAVALAITGADGNLSPDEFESIFQLLEEEELFRDHKDINALATKLELILGREFQDGVILSDGEIDTVLKLAHKILNYEQSKLALDVAVRFAFSDDMHDKEKAMLYKITEGLDITADDVEEIMSKYQK